MKHSASIIIFLIIFCLKTMGAEPISPDGSYLYCKRDTCDLYMDVYYPKLQNSSDTIGNLKPSILFISGRGFSNVSRYNEQYASWFRKLNENGFKVISIDYRTGLRPDDKTNSPQANQLVDNAIHLALEDLFCAINFIIDNAEQLEVNPENIVASGSSAGAIIAMQAEYEICNSTKWASVLPEGFRFAGIMSLAGGVLSPNGELKYAESPAPTLLIHGTEDNVVPYNQIKSGKYCLYGSGKIVKKFQKSGFQYNMYHFKDAGHEISEALQETFDIQLNFLDNNIIQKRPRIIDAWISDTSIR